MKKLLPLIALALLPGCASIVDAVPATVKIQSIPPDARMTLCNERTEECLDIDRTPYVATLERGEGFFTPAVYSEKCEKDGYEPSQATIAARINPWYAGNLLFGGAIGFLLVDPATGAMWKIKEDKVVLYLSPKNTTNIN